MGFNPFKSIDNALDKGSNALQRAASSVRNELNDTTRTIRRTSSSAVNTVRREIGETRQTVSRTARNAVNTTRSEIGETRQTVSRTANSTVNTARREIGETSHAVRRTANSTVNTARREWNETTQAVRRTTNNVANTARREIGETSHAVQRTTNNVANTARREWNETTQVVRRTTNSTVNTARREIGETSHALRRTTNSAVNTARREWNETTQVVRRTTNSVNIVNQWWEKTQPQLGLLGHQVDFIIGVAEGAWDMGKGLLSLATNPLLNPTAMVYGLATNPNGTLQRNQDTLNGMLSLAQNPAVQSLVSPNLAVTNLTSRPHETRQAFRDLGIAFVQPYVDDWESGHPGQSFGRGFFDVGSLLIPGGAGVAGRTGTGARVAARTATQTSDIASRIRTPVRVTDEAGDATVGSDRLKIEDKNVFNFGPPSPGHIEQTDYLVSYFGKDVARNHLNGNFTTLGNPVGNAWFISKEASEKMRNLNDVAWNTGMAQSVVHAIKGGSQEIYGIRVPTEGLQGRITRPEAGDGGSIHWREGGYTAVALRRPDGSVLHGSYFVNRVQEFVVPGQTSVPKGSTIFKFTPTSKGSPAHTKDIAVWTNGSWKAG